MHIFVKAAHIFRHSFWKARRCAPPLYIFSPRELVTPNIIWPPVRMPNNNGKSVDFSWSMHSRCIEAYDELKVEDHEIISCDMQHCDETIRRSVPLTVESTLTVGALKTMLKSHPWIPKTNLVLVQREVSPLVDENSTLEECGIKDQDTLLVCMGGSFHIVVYYVHKIHNFSIPISSCFETVGDLKDKLSQLTGYPRQEHAISYQWTSLDANEETRLVALGIVRPYLGEISNRLTVQIPKVVKLYGPFV